MNVSPAAHGPKRSLFSNWAVHLKASPYRESHYSDLWSETAFVSGSWPQDPPELSETKEVCKVDNFRCDRKVT